MAVCIYNGYKSYVKIKPEINSEDAVLGNFSMNVPKGSLYGLLGSSGCGKTTALSCIVGLSQLDSGTVLLFGNSNIQTQLNKVGYMPQELSLFKEFSILETLMYFGCLFSKTRNKSYLKERAEFLQKLLYLPKLQRIVGTLSGGQCRRVSLAVALVHEPELLVLDEPSAGVDPLVRECIWKHLKYLTSQKRTTVLLTTHYIDEAKQADVVGILRKGRLIVEKSPNELLENLQVDSLEAAFLQLCKQEDNSTDTDITNTTNMLEPTPLSTTNCKPNGLQISPTRIREVAKKNVKVLFRSIFMLGFIVAVPAFCMFITCIAFQYDAVGIKLGVYNLDAETTEGCSDNLYTHWPCRTDQLSCAFLRNVPTDVIDLKYFSTNEEAHSAVEKGEVWGFLKFPQNYSDSWMGRVLNSPDVNQFENGGNTWNNTFIRLSMDKTNSLVYGIIISTLYETMEQFAMKLLDECGQDERNGQFPLHYLDPIVGNRRMTCLHYIAPGLAIGILFFFPLTVSIRFISEKRQGTLDRCLASGIQIWEILIAYIITEFFILLCQSFLLYSILHFGFSIGSSILVSPENVLLTLALCILTGICALTFGFLLGLVCNGEGEAAMIIIAIIFPNSFISGILWPREGMPELVQKISIFFPMTLPAEALRSLMTRQWGIEHESVWQGFLVPVAFIFINVVLIGIIIRRRKMT